MLSRWVRSWDSRLLAPIIVCLHRWGANANILTLVGLMCFVLAALAISVRHLLLAGVLLLAGGSLDGLDGELARVTGTASGQGALLDSLADHCGDFAVYLGLLLLMVRIHSKTSIVLVFVTSFGSLFASLVRARAEVAGIDTKDIGVATRFERVLILAIGLFAAQPGIALWLLAFSNNVVAAQRLTYVLRRANILTGRSDRN